MGSESGTSTLTSLADYGLDGVDCKVCGNSGYVLYSKDGYAYAKECGCMAKRRSIRMIRNSGMSDMLGRYTFDSYETPDAGRERIKEQAKRFAESESGWMYVFGQSGSGKTHICTAVCVEFLSRGKEIYYMPWRDESTALKGLVTETDVYQQKMRKLKTVSVLYIDDFFKGGYTDADIRLAYEILNSRYNNTKLRTIISSEMRIDELLDCDEALGGRVYERSKGYTVEAPKENWRLR